MSSEYLPTIAQIYRQRWQIETLFGAFKSRGLNLAGVNNYKRINTFLFVESIRLTWAIRSMVT
ncbi:transposase [Xanthocytophaga agilis]|uniref:transposase n=1 Tax=Xanthocytophaga agilis TaxID=3048010 RepID=UPI003B00790F